MELTLTDEQRLMRDSLSGILAAAKPASVARSWAEGDPEPGLAAWRGLTEFGVPALLVSPDRGGLGLGAAGLVVAGIELGRAAFPGPTLETVAVLPPLLESLGQTDALDSLIGGELSISPKPPWFVNNRTAATTGRLLTAFTGKPSWAKLPAIFVSALRG